MNGVTLIDYGDTEERTRWPAISQFFPLYETFWKQHIFPLRGADGRIRGDIDERLELMAQEHYKGFISLSIALGGLTVEDHPERTFSSLHNAGNRGREVVQRFNAIRAECLPANPDAIDPEPFADFCRDTARYRNYVHEDVMVMIHYQGRRYLPRPDRLEHYRRWSRMQNPPLTDFEPLTDVLRTLFDRLVGLLDGHWRAMLDRSPETLATQRYAQLLPVRQPAPAQTVPIVLSSNVQLG
jgi:hypothetical protein